MFWFLLRRSKIWTILLLLGTLLLTSCTWEVQGSVESEAEPAEPNQPTATASATEELAPEGAQPLDVSPTPTAVETSEQVNDSAEPAAVNPLTGIAVADPASLCVPPVLVSVSNFPPSARPQAGLAFASQVWETFIGEGMTRFLAVFYGPYYEEIAAALENRLTQGSDQGFVIGPIRSGRVVFEDIKTLFPKGWLITAGASAEVKAQLSNRSSVFGSDPEDINSAGLDPEDLPGAEACTVDASLYGDLKFTEEAPAGGQPMEFVRIVYNLYNQIGWTWSQQAQAYLRSQDEADGSGELVPSVEALTGEQLAFENVLVLWAQHRYVTPTILEMELVFVRDRYGLLFRDGQVYEVKWSTPSGRLLVHDADGNPVPLAPGRTFFEVVSYQTTWNPAGQIIRYHNPPLTP